MMTLPLSDQVLDRLAATRSRLLDHVDKSEDYARAYNYLDNLLAERRVSGSKCVPPEPRKELGFVYLRTSATTGPSKTIQHSWSTHKSVIKLGVQGLTKGGYAEFRRCMIALPAGQMRGAFLFSYEIAQKLEWDTFAMGSDAPLSDYWDIISQYQVDTLVATPSIAHDILNSAPPLPSLATIFYIGETVSAAISTSVSGSNAQIEWVPLSLSTTETGPIGFHQKGDPADIFRIHWDSALIDIIDLKSGKILEPGKRGAVHVTLIDSTDPQTIFYNTGDIGSLEQMLGGQLALRLHGRPSPKSNINLKSGHSFILDYNIIEQILVAAPSGKTIQLKISEAGGWCELKSITGQLDENTIARVREYLSAASQGSINFTHVCCQSVAEFSKTFGGKTPLLYVIDRIAK